MSLKIHSIPIEVFLDHLLPIIDIKDLLSLACTDRFFAELCADDTFWKRRLKDDMNYSIVDARNKGFKLLYRGIRRPRVYVWGAKADGRLGIEDTDDVYSGPGVLRAGIPFPAELPMDHTRTVSIVAGGWSFTTLDEEGRLHVWGKLDAEGFTNTYGDLGDSAHCQRTPVTLVIPVPITSISAGRRHLLCLDAKHQVWLFASWGRPARIVSPQIQDPTSRTSRVVQVEAGWDMIAVLTEAGHVLLEWPYHGEFNEQIVEHHNTMSETPNRGSDTRLSAGIDVLNCATWDIHREFLELPGLPNNLPVLDREAANSDNDKELRIVKIAAGEGFVVALTNQGHVLKMDITPSAESLDELRNNFKNGWKKWIYLPEFCETGRVQESFTAKGITPPDALRITHISATFLTFTAYSTGNSSVVLLGNDDTNASTPPNIVPALQNRSIISVVLGDYHFGALTEDGTMLTWGSYSNGALGLGDPVTLPAGTPGGYNEPVERNPHAIPVAPGIFRGPLTPLPPVTMFDTPPQVSEPTQVRFDQIDGKDDKFVFAITASGWHTAALVIDMNPSELSKSLNDAGDQGLDHRADDHHTPDDGPQMPGAYPPGSARGRGRVGVYPQPGPLHPRPFNPFAPVEPIAPRVARGADMARRPMGRVGFAGRGWRGHTRAIPGAVGSHSLDGGPTPGTEIPRVNADDVAEQEISYNIPRGIRGVRLGYAARGAYAGHGIGRALVEARGGAESQSSEQSPREELDVSGGDSSGPTGEHAGRGAFRGRTLAGGYRGIPTRSRGGAPGSNEDHIASSSD